MNIKITFYLLLLPTLVFSQFGPGGVGNSSDNGLWLRADGITGLADGASVITWMDLSGNNNHATNPMFIEQPIYKANSAIAGRPSVYFDGVNDQMIIGDNPLLDGNDGIFFYTVIRPHNLRKRGILGKRIGANDPSKYSYIFSFYSTGDNLALVTNQHSNQLIDNTVSHFANTNYMLGFESDRYRVGERMRIFSAGSIVTTGPGLDEPITNSIAPLVIGGHNENYIRNLGADYSEVIQFNRALNSAERKIVENYLGAKYQIAVANPYYFHSAYAGEVAGIGQDDAINTHNDSQGTAMVRINTPSSLNDGDYLLWGHNETSMVFKNIIDVNQTTIQSRMERVWAVTETGDVGTVTISFDVSDFTPITHSDVRLLIADNGNNFINAQVIIPTSIAGNIITFENIDFIDNDYFTLGSINVNATPLPVELTDFHLTSEERYVNVLWTTASELNADYYILSKSKDGKSFENFAKVESNGTTSSTSHYKEIDNAPFNGISYYRLTQVDFDGKSTNYGLLSVNRNQEQSFFLVPNPTDGVFKLRSAVLAEGNTTVSVYTSVGIKVNETSLSADEINEKPIDFGLSAGVYFVRIIQENGFNTSMKLVVK